LTVVQETTGFVGGYLITNTWGRPLEFRLSTAVQPNRVQQILYGETLRPYVCGELIGKALVDRSATSAQLILTDCEAVRDLRHKLEVPVVWLASPNDPLARTEGGSPTVAAAETGERGPLLCHPRYPTDLPVVRSLLSQLDSTFDLMEPFARIREAVGEARKLGVAKT
jgi:hypothetical protein